MPYPTRTCVGCRTRRPQPELLPVGRRPDGVVVPDVRRARPGRTAYLCPDKSCLDRALKRRAFARALGQGQTVIVDAPTLWPALTAAVDADIDTLKRTTGPTGSRRLAALRELQSQLREGGV